MLKAVTYDCVCVCVAFGFGPARPCEALLPVAEPSCTCWATRWPNMLRQQGVCSLSPLLMHPARWPPGACMPCSRRDAYSMQGTCTRGCVGCMHASWHRCVSHRLRVLQCGVYCQIQGLQSKEFLVTLHAMPTFVACAQHSATQGWVGSAKVAETFGAQGLVVATGRLLHAICMHKARQGTCQRLRSICVDAQYQDLYKTCTKSACKLVNGCCRAQGDVCLEGPEHCSQHCM